MERKHMEGGRRSVLYRTAEPHLAWPCNTKHRVKATTQSLTMPLHWSIGKQPVLMLALGCISASDQKLLHRAVLTTWLQNTMQKQQLELPCSGMTGTMEVRNEAKHQV